MDLQEGDARHTHPRFPYWHSLMVARHSLIPKGCGYYVNSQLSCKFCKSFNYFALKTSAPKVGNFYCKIMNRSRLVFIVALAFLRLLYEFSSCNFQKFIRAVCNCWCDHHYSFSFLDPMKRLFVLQILQLHITLFRFHCVSPKSFC